MVAFWEVLWIWFNTSASHVVAHTGSQHKEQLYFVLGRMHCSLANVVPLGNRIAILTGAWHRLKILHRHMVAFAGRVEGGGEWGVWGAGTKEV